MRGLLSMLKINSSFLFKVLPRACLIFVICVSLIAFSSYTAPKAQAEALTLSVASAFLLLAVSVMATLGVTLIAPSTEHALEYMDMAFRTFLREVKEYSGTVADFLLSLGFNVISLLAFPVHGAINITKQAYDLMAEFTTWFFYEHEVESGGDPVGQLPESVEFGIVANSGISLNGTPSYSWVDSNTVSVTIPSGSIVANTQRNIFIGGIPASDLEFPCSVQIPEYRGIPSQFTNVSVGLGPNAAANNNNFWFRQNGSNYQDSVNVTSTQYGNYLNVRLNSTFSTGASWSAFTITIILAAQQLVSDGGFVIEPSDNVTAPPSVAVGQSYSIPAQGVTPSTSVEEAINTAIAPLTTSGGYSTTGSVSGTAVESGLEWLYEDTQAIRNNTNPHFDFIPSSLGFDFAIWHYVTEMMTAVSDSFALLGTFISNMPPAVLVFPFGVFALAITVALFRRFLS